MHHDAPSYKLYTQVWASRLLATIVPRQVAQVFPFHSLLHSSLYHMPPPFERCILDILSLLKVEAT